MTSTSLNQNIPPQTLSRIAKEVRNLIATPVDGVIFIPNEKDLTDIQADLIGPDNTAYAGGRFRCKLVVGSDFPSAPPRGVFLTKIFHPNVSPNGEICVNTLKKDWNSELGLPHVFQVIRCLLIVPFPESALNEEASKLFLESYDDYFRRAQLLTSIHAMHPATTSSSNNNNITSSSHHHNILDTTESTAKLIKTVSSESAHSTKGNDQNIHTTTSTTTTTAAAVSSNNNNVTALPKKTSSKNALKRL
jgi:ubiquitin-conjugating enzyme E2 S